MRQEFLVPRLLHLLDEHLGVTKDVPEGRAKIVKEIARKRMLNRMQHPRRRAHRLPPAAELPPTPLINASILPSSLDNSIGFVS